MKQINLSDVKPKLYYFTSYLEKQSFKYRSLCTFLDEARHLFIISKYVLSG